MRYKRIEIKGEYDTSEVCGNRCIFCRFDQSDDLYHCVFFPGRDDMEIVNICAEEGGRHWGCPVILREDIHD